MNIILQILLMILLDLFMTLPIAIIGGVVYIITSD